MLVVTVALSPPAEVVDVVHDGGVEIEWVTAEGQSQSLGLNAAARVAFEDGLPVRRFRPHKGQRHLGGRWWCATTARHVGFESWLERDHAMLLDFDSRVVGIAAQPFWLSWRTSAGEQRSHAPDFFARRDDGSAVVIDCRPVERRRPADVAKFAATGQACALLGWEYRLVGAVDPVVTANLRWLSAYRHPRHDVPAVATPLREVFGAPAALMEGAAAVGDPVAVLPVLFHLLWRQQLTADLERPLNETTTVRSA